MNIKKLVIALTLSFTMLILTGCLHLLAWTWAEQSRPKNTTTSELQDARGGGVSPCGANYIMTKHSGQVYLKRNGLPVEIEGNFICENGKPALPKDCEGKEMRSVAELEAYWKKYQLPRGLIRYDCSSGVPKVRQKGLHNWQREERINPTCTDERGRPKPCV